MVGNNKKLVMQDSHGFSLVELMIVIVIVGILAAVAVPIYNNNVIRAYLGEADAALGSINTQIRIYYAEWGEYPIVNPNDYVVGASWNDIKVGEITGNHFSDSSYTYGCRDGSSYIITCAAGAVLNSDRTLRQDGTFYGGIRSGFY